MVKLIIHIKPSRLWLVTVMILHMVAIVAIVVAAFSGWLKGVLLLGVVLSGYYHIGLKELQNASWAIMKCERNENDWTLNLKNGREVAVQLKKDVFVSPWFLILHFKTSEESWWPYRSLVIFKDSVDADIFRRTKVFLLQGRNE